MTIAVRPLREDEREWVRGVIADRWGSETVVAHGVAYRPATLPGFVAEENGRAVGILTYHVEDDACEIVTLDAFEDGRGVGSALVDAAKAVSRRRLWLVTTNDNAGAQRFYERRGFQVVAVHKGAVDRSRELKPEIPLVGLGGVEIHDEIEMERTS